MRLAGGGPALAPAGASSAKGGKLLRLPLEEVEPEDRHAGGYRRGRREVALLDRPPGGDAAGGDQGDRERRDHERASLEKTVSTTFTQH
jgi:hypothetical protein